ncbi:UNVERIFIED_CONTAM: hypothetical protein HDU68_005040, partial [Siphonaria sp. JEL0065]
ERAASGNVVGAYLLIDPVQGPAKLAQVVASADTLPINRVTLSFVRPDIHHIPKSNTLATVGFNYGTSGDYGFAEVKAAVAQIQAAGVDVFLSMGGWDYNWLLYRSLWNPDVIKQYGGGNIDNCNTSNPTNGVTLGIEPPSNGNIPDAFAIFPELSWSSVWKQATADVVTAQGQKGTSKYPYQDFVYLAKDLGLAGILNADTFKTGDAGCTNPCTLWQTVYKYTAISRDLQLSIQSIYPTLKISTAAAAVGAWNSEWWGGNMKGLWYGQNQIMPALTKFMTQGANAGGFNIMSYDISTASDECPQPGVCSLSQQVDFYLNTYKTMLGSKAGIYEIGTPACELSKTQLQKNASLIIHLYAFAQMANLRATEWPKLLSNTQANYPGGFYWEITTTTTTVADSTTTTTTTVPIRTSTKTTTTTTTKGVKTSTTKAATSKTTTTTTTIGIGGTSAGAACMPGLAPTHSFALMAHRIPWSGSKSVPLPSAKRL